jgi:DNA-binding transcriptional regulator YiaG
VSLAPRPFGAAGRSSRQAFSARRHQVLVLQPSKEYKVQMSFSGTDIRTLRQRLGWSVAEMARRMGCNTDLIHKWETQALTPDSDALNQLRYLKNHAESHSDLIAQKPLCEKEMEERRMAQLTHRDLLKDVQ